MRNIVFDSTLSQRTFDSNGYLHIAMTPISKAMVCPYLGSELKAEGVDLEAGKIYYGLRDPKEIEKSVDTFNNLPVLNRHHPIDSQNIPKEYIVGSTGTDAEFDGKYLKNSMCIYDDQAIQSIEDGTQQEISCAYAFTPDFKGGTFTDEDGNKIHYDFVMKDLKGNHIALVEEGRAGHDVKVADSMPEKIDGKHQQRKENAGVNDKDILSKGDLQMEEKLKDCGSVNFKDAEPEEIKEIEDTDEEVKEVADEDINEVADDKKALIDEIGGILKDKVDEEVWRTIVGKVEELAYEGEAKDEDIDEEKVQDDELEEAKDEQEGEHEGMLNKVEELEHAIVKHEGDDDEMFKDPMYRKGFEHGMAKAKQAVDDATPMLVQDSVAKVKTALISQFRAMNKAADVVKPLVGNIKDIMAFDSADAIYKFALDKSGINTKAYDCKAYKGMVDMLLKGKQKSKVVVNDSAIISEEDKQIAELTKRLKNIH